jgi:hypothetical protein
MVTLWVISHLEDRVVDGISVSPVTLFVGVFVCYVCSRGRRPLNQAFELALF